MANVWYAAHTGNWNATGAWSSTSPIYFVGSRSGNVVTIGSAGVTTAGMTVGMNVWFATSATNPFVTTTATSIINSTQFTTASSGTVTNNFWIIKTTRNVPTSADDVFFSGGNSAIPTVTVQAGTTYQVKSLTLEKTTGSVGGSMNIVGGSVSGAQLVVNGSFRHVNFTLNTSNLTLNLRGSGSGITTDTIYQAPTATTLGLFSINAQAIEYTLLSDLRATSSTAQWFMSSGRLNLNGFAVTCGRLTIQGVPTVRPYIDFTNGGTFRCTATSSSSQVPFTDVTAQLYTVGNGFIELAGATLLGQVVNIGSTTAPALGTQLCNFKYIFSSGAPNFGTNFYCDTIDISTITGSFATGNWYIKGLIWPNASSLTTAMSNITLFVVSGGGTINWISGQTPNITINHNGTTTFSTNWGSTTYFRTLNLTSGTLALAASTVATFGPINASGTTARSLTFGAGSYIQGGNTTAQTKTWANATNFTVTGTFNMQTGGTGTQTIIFGTSGGATTSPNNAPEYTYTQSGDALSGYFKKINSNGFAPSTAVQTIWCNDFTGGSAFYYNTTLYAWGTSPAYIKGTTTLAEIGVDGVPKTIIFTAGTTQTVTNFTVNGTLGNLVTLESSSAGSQFNLSKSSGAVTVNYLSLKDSNATGGATWTALTSTFLTNVTGWLGNVVAVYVKSRFLQFFG